MNRSVQILLLAAILPMALVAKEQETLEERKKRITRKYMRERIALSQSDMEVPSLVTTEEEQVLESEKFKGQEVDLQRQQGTAAPPPPMRRPMPRPQEKERNWLLQGMEDEETNPYADPLGRDKSEDLKSDYWSSRRDRTTGESRYGSDRSQNPYERRSYNPYDTRSRYSQSYLNSGAGYQSDQRSLYGSSQKQESRYGAREQWRTGGLSSGQQQERSTTPGTSLYSSRTYGSSPQSGMLQYPSTSSSTDSSYRRSGTTEERQQGYKPYVSPFQTRKEEQRKSPWQTQPRTETKEYKPSSTVQEWKNRNESWDPAKTQDYMDEMMRRDSR